MESLYEKIGGAASVNAAVDIFYQKVLADNRVKKFFEGVDMKRQIGKQKAFLTFAFGGPARYSGKSMSKGHQHLVKMGLNDSHVDAVVELLGKTLQELKVPNELINQVVVIAEGVRGQVLGKET